ncbi:MAG TPA: Stp1/IreP family PP2C-type Ser/Thr phosphatase [Candidatus Acidoferrales bacterium]|nr:Stp1/IreP family PP2C-type Ser/Thr phosphatase [Candidatus Acidoferrales bacterium]
MELEFGAQSDRGCVRENNEDSYRAAPDLNLFILSDGMGGLDCGEVASRLAVDTILEHCRKGQASASFPFTGLRIDGVSELTNRLASAVRVANHAVHSAAQHSATNRPMGATVVAVQFADERMSLANVGDSRVYRLRGEDFEQLTRDHSFVAEQMRQGRMTAQEADSSKLHNVLIRALGVDPEVEVDASEELVLEGDTVLLCSDGLTRELSDSQISAVLRETEDAQEATERLIDLAKQAGGGDNITAIVLRSAARPVGALGRVSRLGKWIKDSAERHRR